MCVCVCVGVVIVRHTQRQSNPSMILSCLSTHSTVLITRIAVSSISRPEYRIHV